MDSIALRVKHNNKDLVILAVLFFVVLIFVGGIYFSNLSNYLILDDIWNFNPLKMLDVDVKAWSSIVQGNTSGPLGRPISMLTFVLDWLGSTDHYLQFKKTNIAIHLICGCLCYLFISKLLCATKEFSRYRYYIALLTAVLWLSAPIHVSTVMYSVQRMAQLACLFSLLAMVSYVYIRQSTFDSALLSDLLALFCSFFFIVLAMFSKENGIVSFGILFLIELLGFNFVTNGKESKLLKIVWCAIALLALILLMIIFYTNFSLEPQPNRNFNTAQRLLTQIHVVFEYLRNIVVPNINGMTIYHDSYHVVTNFWSNPYTFVKSMLLCSPLVGFIYLKNETVKFCLFGYLFYIFAIFPESSFFSLELYFEHRNYLPSVGITFAMSILFFALYSRLEKNKLILIGGVLYIVCITINLNVLASKWKSKEKLIAHSYKAHPESRRVVTDVMQLLGQQGRFIEAHNVYLDVSQLRHEHKTSLSGDAMINLCYLGYSVPDWLYNNLSQPWQSVDAHMLAAKVRHVGRLVMGGKCNAVNNDKLAEILAKKVAETKKAKPTNWRVHIALAYIEIASKKYRKANQTLLAAWDMYPEIPSPGLMITDLAIKLEDKKLLAESLERLQKYKTEYTHREVSELEKIIQDTSSGIYRVRYIKW